MLKTILSSLTPPKQLWTVLRWILSIAALFYIGQLLLTHWNTVDVQPWHREDFLWGSIALLLALIAQLCATCLWGFILDSLQYPVSLSWSFVVVSQNQLGKYLPGSIWHIVGRVQQSQQAGVPWDVIALSMVLEPLFFIVGSLFWALGYSVHPLWEGSILMLALIGLHPRCFNLLYKVRKKEASDRGLSRYPLRELAVAIGLMGLRCGMFLAIVQIFCPLNWGMARILVGGFSLAWITRIVSPTPAGLGIFEFTILQALGSELEQAILLGAIAFYRILTLVAEVILALVAYAFSLANLKSANLLPVSTSSEKE